MVIGIIILLLRQNTLKGICTHICWMMTDWMNEQMNKDARKQMWPEYFHFCFYPCLTLQQRSPNTSWIFDHSKHIY